MNFNEMIKQMNVDPLILVETIVKADMPSVIVFKNNQSEITYVNDQFYHKHKQFAYCREKVIGLTDFDLFPDSLAHAKQAYEDEQYIMASGKSINILEIEGTDQNGEPVVAHTRKYPLYNSHHEVIGILVMTEDITSDVATLRENREKNSQLMKINEELTQENSTDSLSHLYNRRYIYERLKQIHDLFIHKKTPYSLLLLDLDNFKGINDTYGHQIGDQVISYVGEVLWNIKKNVYPSMEPCRYGGDEFIIILPAYKKEGAVSIANDIKEAFDNQVLDLGKFNQIVEMSIGIATINDNESYEEVLKRCDECLYSAKKCGKNRIFY